jgi:PIN domain nuclease of toxin-antitoxin system
MNILLDTHAFIWWNEEDKKIPPSVSLLLKDPANQIWLSMASVWEMQIKIQLGKLKLKRPLSEFIDQEVRINRLRLLSIGLGDIYHLNRLPMHHRDPFDRIIIAQAMGGGFQLVSDDSDIKLYGLSLLW